jgi:D-alanine transfer protein
VRRTSLFAAGLALAVMAAVLLATFAVAKRSLSSHLDQVALANLKTSRLGLAVQKAVLSRDDYLPVLGSCEMTLRVLERIDNFFASKPTGFRVEPIGQAGNTDLLIAQTCAALGPAIRDKKLVVIISPEWFFEPGATDAQYAGNFSVEQALAALTSPNLDGAIKRRIATRMAEYSRTLTKSPILKQLVLAVQEDNPTAKIPLRIATLCSACYERILNLSDSLFTWVEFATTRRRLRPISPPMTASGIDWAGASSNAEQEFQKMTDGNPLGFPKKIWLKLVEKDQSMLPSFRMPRFENIATTKEWEDFDIMLEVLKQSGAKPLILAMPVNGRFFATLGAEKQAWGAYYSKLHEAARHYGFPLYDFQGYEDDPRFRGFDNLNPEGWLHLDMMADAFFHDRLSEVSTL